MSQISRLHSTEIANGNLIDATHLNAEFDQLVAESNSQDTRLTAAETKITNQTGSLKSMIHGLVVEYNNPNRVTIKPGLCRDDANTELMQVTADITVDLSASGANGLDTGTEAADTWYYLWLIKNTTTGTVAGLFSTSNSNPTLPGGYNKKRLLPIAVKNDGLSNILPFYVASGWPHMPVVMFDVEHDGGKSSTETRVLTNGSSTSFTGLSLAAYVPSISRTVLLYTAATAAGMSVWLRPTGSSALGLRLTHNEGVAQRETIVGTNSSQSIDYRVNTDSVRIDVRGFVVTEVN